MNMNELLKLNDELYGAPSGVLLVIFAIALGYLLKTVPMFNPKLIPLVVVAICTVGFMLIAPARPADMAFRIYIGRNFIIGFVIGFAAWTFHAQILKRWIDPKIFAENNNNEPNKNTNENNEK